MTDPIDLEKRVDKLAIRVMKLEMYIKVYHHEQAEIHSQIEEEIKYDTP